MVHREAKGSQLWLALRGPARSSEDLPFRAIRLAEN